MKNIWSILGIISGVVFLDQLTKYLLVHFFHYQVGDSTPIVNGIFNITYVRNPGAAFGFLASASEQVRQPLFLYLPVLAVVGLGYLIWKTKDHNKVLTLAYTMIVAGAIGNLIDRFRLGYVVDFLDFYLGDAHFPAFNVADSTITIAAGLLLFDLYLQSKKMPLE